MSELDSTAPGALATPTAGLPLPRMVVSENTLRDWALTPPGQRIDKYPGASDFLPHADHTLAVRQHLREAWMVLHDHKIAVGLQKRILQLIGEVGSLPPQLGA